MTTHTVETATAAEEAAVLAVLTLAFSNDPATRWTWPDPKTYLEAFPHFAKAFGGAAFGAGSAHRIGSAGAALWLPPGVGSDDAAIGALIGIDPAHQGKGLGGTLIKQATDICDRDGALAYLESSNLRNVPLYERHGFEVLGTIQAGQSPTIVPMLRKPRKR
jgi:GNAT superfamily N-acetyltransferase